jgi:hypothetical protein
MPGLVPGIHVFLSEKKGVDGRDMPGHDEGGAVSKESKTPRIAPRRFLVRYPGSGAYFIAFSYG